MGMKEKTRFRLDKEKCIRCGKCIDILTKRNKEKRK